MDGTVLFKPEHLIISQAPRDQFEVDPEHVEVVQPMGIPFQPRYDSVLIAGVTLDVPADAKRFARWINDSIKPRLRIKQK